jgi:hypothetical protein
MMISKKWLAISVYPVDAHRDSPEAIKIDIPFAIEAGKEVNVGGFDWLDYDRTDWLLSAQSPYDNVDYNALLKLLLLKQWGEVCDLTAHVPLWQCMPALRELLPVIRQGEKLALLELTDGSYAVTCNATESSRVHTSR